MSVTDIGADKRIFLRKASGLIRTAGLTDTFIYNLGVVSIGLGVGSMLYYGPAFYPQGNLVWGCIIAGIAMTLISLGFITWTITLPRSGGIYVFGSRILPPALALTMSLVEITAWLFYCAIAAYWIVILALAPMFAALNLLTGNETFLTISKTRFGFIPAPCGIAERRARAPPPRTRSSGAPACGALPARPL